MTNSFSIQTITALTDVVTGGSSGNGVPPIGLYRSGPELQRFFGNLGFELTVGSRVPSVRDLLLQINQHPRWRTKIIEIIESATDPRDFLENPEKLNAVVEHLNKRLQYDGYQLKPLGNRHKVVSVGTNAVAATSLKEVAKKHDMESVQRDFDQAITEAENNPEGAITAACSTIESVCKCLLDELKVSYPAKQDIKGLVSEIGKHLNLSPGREDLPSEYEHDIRQILSGLVNVTSGIGALRTHAGDAHGRGKNPVRIDARVAKLAIHAANTISLFLIETWQRRSEKK